MKHVSFIFALAVFAIACSSTISTIDNEAEKMAVRAVWDATVSGAESVIGRDTLLIWYVLVFEKEDGEWKMVLGNDVEVD